MFDYKIGTDLPLDVSSRVESLFSLVSETQKRVTESGNSVLAGLLRDFQEMAREYILLFEENVKKEISTVAKQARGKSPRKPMEIWQRRHSVLDKLTREWHRIYNLVSAIELGTSFLDEFNKYVELAVKDIGLTDAEDNFLLIPTFGEFFSLTSVRYSTSKITILRLPISVIKSPWEYSVVWHEMAGLKVRKIGKQIKEFLEVYAKENNISLPNAQEAPGIELIGQLFERLVKGDDLDDDFKAQIKNLLLLEGSDSFPDDIWPQDWFEQLYEDACSVFAFGETFIPVLEKILGRQAHKLSSDKKHPDLDTRLRVARRLLVLQNEDAPAVDPGTPEQLTDDLLWVFIQQQRPDSDAYLPVAFSGYKAESDLRKNLVDEMESFNKSFGDIHGEIVEKPYEFHSLISRNQEQTVYEERITLVKELLQSIFRDAGIDELLNTPFSDSDELTDFVGHNREQWGSMSISSNDHGSHTVWHGPPQTAHG